MLKVGRGVEHDLVEPRPQLQILGNIFVEPYTNFPTDQDNVNAQINKRLSSFVSAILLAISLHTGSLSSTENDSLKRV